MTETLSPPACRCGSPATNFFDRGGSTAEFWNDPDAATIALCDSCAHKEGFMNELTPMPNEPRPTSMLDLAISKGMDADSIAKIVGLMERREAAEAESAYSEAIRTVSESVGVVLKSKQGSKSKYAPLDDVNRALIPLYTAAGLSISFSEADCPFADKGWKRHVCDVRHSRGHKERYHLDLPLDNMDGKNPGMTPIQAAISTGSYIQRVLLCRIFNVTISDSDKDGQSLQDVLLITPEQLSDLKDLIVQNAMDEARLLKWLGAESKEKITRAQFAKFETTYMQRKAVK